MKINEDDRICVKVEIVEFNPNFNFYQLVLITYCEFPIQVGFLC